MPTYEYECSDCGSFTANQPMAQYQEPQACPECSQLAPRALISAPAFAAMPGGTRKAHAINEKAAHAPKSSKEHVHSSGCGCGGKIGKSATVQAKDGSKAFPNKRPWMISH
jgi:putative FmdB family regulatory protein